MSEKTMQLLPTGQQAYLMRILNNRQFFKNIGKKFVSVEKSMIDNCYKVYLLEHLERSAFDDEIVEYIEL